jgi:hypothetical protein
MKFRAEVELTIEDLEAYVGQPTRSTSHLNELVKEQIIEDLSDALQHYGIDGEVCGVRKVNSRETH